MKNPRALVLLAASLLVSSASVAKQSGDEVGNLGSLGFVYRYEDGEPTGVMIVTKVFEGSPAESAGVHVGDRLVAFNGAGFRFEGAPEIVRALDWVRPGQRVLVEIAEGERRREVELVARAMTEEEIESRERRIVSSGSYVLDRLAASRGAFDIRATRLDEGVRYDLVFGEEVVPAEGDLVAFLDWYPPLEAEVVGLSAGSSLQVRVKRGPAGAVIVLADR